MNIIYTCDDNYAWLMGISMISLFEKNKSSDNLKVYLLGDEITTSTCRILTDIAKKYNRDFELIDVPNLNIPKSLCTGRWPKSAFTRMFAAELLPPALNKVLYLDADTIVNDSIIDLFEFDSQEFAVSGVKDCVSKFYKGKIGIKSKASYINAGVLLLNLDILRKIDIRDRMNKFLDSYEFAVNYADQDVLNGIFGGQFGILPPQYNVMTLNSVYSYNQIQQLRRPSNYYSRKEVDYSTSHPVIIHYTTCLLNVRPWCVESFHPFAWLFKKYKLMSPWAEKPFLKTDFSSKEHRIMSKILMLPDTISFPLIGLIHSFMSPVFKRIKSILS
jgi:lipopolysaccharide biosynthesis glycosyltransferase